MTFRKALLGFAAVMWVVAIALTAWLQARPNSWALVALLMALLLTTFGALRAYGTLRSDRRNRATRINNSERRVSKVESQQAKWASEISDTLDRLESNDLENLRRSFETGLSSGRSSADLLSPIDAVRLFESYFEQKRLIETMPLLGEEMGVLQQLNPNQLRSLFKTFRSGGYYDAALRIGERLVTLTGKEPDRSIVQKLTSESSVLANPSSYIPVLPLGKDYDAEGPVIHVVGKVLPHTQTGYTLRTHYSVRTQMKRGIKPIVVAQPGTLGGAADSVVEYELDGVPYYILGGPVRNLNDTETWFRDFVTRLADLVADLRPSVLHAHSDFYNAYAISAVGRAKGIPTVYETRGFWEDSWLSRLTDKQGWRENGSWHLATYGTPEAYSYRKRAEEQARLIVDRNLTLAHVMREHMADSSTGTLQTESIVLVPNAVDADEFPLSSRDEELASELGIDSSTMVVGYISSLVEYEGIDTLIRAFRQACRESLTPLKLLIVGTGNHAKNLHLLAGNDESIIFTGRVPHESVLRYYSIIDIFVVPRKPTTVTELVTPLKPFEAFSTGRTVVLSDVRALREIAEESGAALTFRAGNATDLKRVILNLMDDPNLREELAKRGAAWVRARRSWLHNANRYYAIYRELGSAIPINLLAQAQIQLSEKNVDDVDMLSALLAHPQPPAEGWFTIQSKMQFADDLLDNGWRFSSFPPIKIDEIQDWGEFGRKHRSWGFHLHAWEFIDPILRTYDQTEDGKYLDIAIRWAENWIRFHLEAAVGDESMAWYDMSLALRTPRLIALLHRVAQSIRHHEHAPTLLAALVQHEERLSEEEAFNPNNNHGFYCAASQLHLARTLPMLPGANSTQTQGETRMAIMAKSQFSADGCHLEHSPDYHRMLLHSFQKVIEAGLLTDPEVRQRIDRAEYALGWMIQPNGCLVQFGDSPETNVVNGRMSSSNTHTDYLLSEGKRGEPDSRTMMVFSESGYAFIRSPAPARANGEECASYLALTAAFHSRAHKHADDLSVVWFDHGHEILVDAGRYGYGELTDSGSELRKEGFYYAAPERRYIESTAAHNTIMMNGQNHDRLREPYGAGELEGETKDGVFDITGRVPHDGWIHRRRIVLKPGNRLTLLDSVFSSMNDEQTGTLWLNVNGAFELLSNDSNGARFQFPDGSTELHVMSSAELVDVKRGEQDPMRGWRSRKDRTLEPTWSLRFSFEVDTRSAVKTDLILKDLQGKASSSNSIQTPR